MRRLRNPTPLQWGLILGSGALVLGVSTVVYAATRRVGPLPDLGPDPKGPVLPPQNENDDSPDELPASLDWEIVTPTDPGYPWEFPALHFENYPTPGTWWNAGDKTGAFDPSLGFDRFVRALLGSALAMAGNDPTIAAAEGKNKDAATGKRLRREVRQALVAVGGINDLLYGQDNLNLAGGNDPNKAGGDPKKPRSGAHVLNAAGRGLNWLPRHANNLQRIQEGLPLLRTTSLAGRSLPGIKGSRQMLIWSPAFDLDALSPNVGSPSIQFLHWSDGSSTADPPPSIRQLGVDLSGVALPGI